MAELQERVVPFRSEDGLDLDLVNVRGRVLPSAAR